MITPQKSPTVAPQKSPTPVTQTVQGLNPTGSWLLISATDGLWAANPDGSNLVQLTQGEFWQGSPAGAVQPGGNRVVLLTSSGDRYHHLALNLLSLPDGRIQKITDLTTSQTEPGPSAAPGDTSIEAVRAIADEESYAWSPDGTKLAFIGVLDGPTADLYLYDTATKKITRVSQDDAQNYWPSWSPDGKYILFFGAETFGTGAGYLMKGVWSANADGSNVTLLYTPSSSGEELVGWRDDQTAVLDSWKPICGPEELRLYNIVTAQKTVLQAGCSSAAAASEYWGDPNSNTVMFSKDDGLYLWSANGAELQKLSGNQVAWIRWERVGSMFVVKYKDGSMTTLYSTAGNLFEDAPAQAQDVTMFALIWAWTNNTGELPGVWISGPGIDLGQIFDGPAYAPIWNFDNTLFFFSGSGEGTDLYRATFDNYYNDTASVGHLTGEVQGVTWVGIK
jgi:dipeptidyl aminopeptidase/acylaminoacyl peptidase